MNIFRSLFGKSKTPPTSVRDTLFGDLPLNKWPEDDDAGSFPWSAFVSAQSRIAQGQVALATSSWREVLASPNLESRHYLQAWHFLRQHGEQPPNEIKKRVLGVIVEVGMSQGLDILAAYVDRTARYYNFSGAGVVWERPNDDLDGLIDSLLVESAKVVAQIGPWTEERLPAPANGQVRLSFLTPSGLHFGQGPMEGFAVDPLAGPVIQSAIQLMQALIKK